MADDFEEKSLAFKDWFLSHDGASINPDVDLADFRSEGRGRGAVALADIPADTELFTIDPSSVLSVTTSELLPRLPQEKQDDLSSKPWPSLILVLIYEHLKGSQSRWWPYMQLLPTEDDFDTLMYWTEQELDELQASTIRHKIGREDAEDMFKSDVIPVLEAHPKLFTSPDHQLDQPTLLRLCHRMASTIMAYAFDVEQTEKGYNADEDGYVTDEDEAAQQKAMMPLADMLNADTDFNAHLFNDEDGLKMRSTRDIKKGEEILNDFGTHPRSELLRRYGYITDKYAKYDVVEIPLSFVVDEIREHANKSMSEINIDKRMADLDDEGLTPEGFIIDRGDPAKIAESARSLPPVELPEDLIELLHALSAEPNAWRNWRKKLSEGQQQKLRSKVYSTLGEIFVARLAQYDTDTEADEELLSKLDLSTRKSMAIQVRLGENRLLQAARTVTRVEASIAGDKAIIESRVEEGLAGADADGVEPTAKRQKLG